MSLNKKKKKKKKNCTHCLHGLLTGFIVLGLRTSDGLAFLDPADPPLDLLLSAEPEADLDPAEFDLEPAELEADDPDGLDCIPGFGCWAVLFILNRRKVFRYSWWYSVQEMTTCIRNFDCLWTFAKWLTEGTMSLYLRNSLFQWHCSDFNINRLIFLNFKTTFNLKAYFSAECPCELAVLKSQDPCNSRKLICVRWCLFLSTHIVVILPSSYICMTGRI